MDDWRPIETYDQMKKKPRRAVFWFAEVSANRPGGFGLDACPNLSRTMGSRICTHWIPLPEDPNAPGKPTAANELNEGDND